MSTKFDRIEGRGCSSCCELIINSWSKIGTIRRGVRKCPRCGYTGKMIDMLKMFPVGCLFVWAEKVRKR